MKIIVNKNIILEDVYGSKKNINATFNLFKLRPSYHRISASKSIAFKNHLKFVKSRIYRKWFIIKFNENYIGTLYFTFENSIGYFILDKYLYMTNEILRKSFRIIKPLPKKLSIKQDYFTINISSKNKKYKKIIKNSGGKEIQNTYIFRRVK
tara:strand:+ start:80 stop:535 length:456 start_codon:yes stop_codon:yes gene_type:complete